MRYRLKRYALWWGLCGWALCGLWACKKAPRQEQRARFLEQHMAHPPARKTNAKTQQRYKMLRRILLSKLAVARSRHQRASIYQQQGDLKRAVGELDLILKMRFPKKFRPGEEMLLDAWARKALLFLKAQRYKRALAIIEQALARKTWLRESFYVAHLHHVRGRILVALKRPKDALAAFQRSIDINKAVIRAAQAQLKALQRDAVVGAHRQAPSSLRVLPRRKP